MLAFVCFTFWYGIQLAIAAAGQSTIALGIPRAATYGIIPLGSLLIALQCLASLLGAQHADATNEMAV